jgi:DNA-directed RNA polymerase subunit H (RpoH/RPB5)
MQKNRFVRIDCEESVSRKPIILVLVSSLSASYAAKDKARVENKVEQFRQLMGKLSIRETKKKDDSDSDSDVNADVDANVDADANANANAKDGSKTKAKAKANVKEKQETKEKPTVIIITKKPFNAAIQKALIKYEDVDIVNYIHRDFACDKRKGPMCSPHRVLTTEEIEELNRFTLGSTSNYPAICIDDQQCIWLNVKVGDLIEVITIEDNAAGISKQYRYVSPKRFQFMDQSKTKGLNASD